MQSRFRVGNVSDPVHGYIPFTGLEREIIGHPVTQRLRYVSQTGLGHLVYPELRSSRFSHCLGAMHLSSQFLAASLRNSDPTIRDELLEAIDQAVAHRFNPPQDTQFQRNVALPAIDSSETALHAYTWCESDHHRRAVAITEQALRLAALFHDLGHLPFSHDFEFALDELRKDIEADDDRPPQWVREQVQKLYRGLEVIDANRFHEVIGPEIGHLILRDILSRHGDDPDDVLYSVFDLAFDIWSAEEPHEIDMDGTMSPRELALSWLKSLVSGELDVDRCDYILRDGRNYGFDFASYDLKRLLGQLAVSQKSGTFVLSVRSQGIGFLESFVMARYRSYQFGVLHHKASQLAAALQYTIGRTIRNAAERGRLGPRQFLEDLNSIIGYRDARGRKTSLPEVGDSPLARFARYDDIWWTETMREVVGENNDPWIDLVLWRSAGPKSLWKRVDDFARVLNELSSATVGQPPGSIPASVLDWNKHLERIDQTALTTGNEWHNTVRSQRRDGILVLRKPIKPFRLDNEDDSVGLYVDSTGKDPVPLTRLSPLARSLRDAWKSDLQVQAFVGEESSDEELQATAIRVVTELWRALSSGSAGGERAWQA